MGQCPTESQQPGWGPFLQCPFILHAAETATHTQQPWALKILLGILSNLCPCGGPCNLKNGLLDPQGKNKALRGSTPHGLVSTPYSNMKESPLGGGRGSGGEWRKEGKEDGMVMPVSPWSCRSALGKETDIDSMRAAGTHHARGVLGPGFKSQCCCSHAIWGKSLMPPGHNFLTVTTSECCRTWLRPCI